jgi:hypothetical protein
MADNNVLMFGAAPRNEKDRTTSNPRKALRDIHGLTVTQAAAALGTTTHNFEKWEATGNGTDFEFADQAFQAYRLTDGPGQDTNQLFAVYPLRVARDMLGYSIEVMAKEFGYSIAGWQKFESNQRLLDRNILSRIETMVRDDFARACHSATRGK